MTRRLDRHVYEDFPFYPLPTPILKEDPTTYGNAVSRHETRAQIMSVFNYPPAPNGIRVINLLPLDAMIRRLKANGLDMARSFKILNIYYGAEQTDTFRALWGQRGAMGLPPLANFASVKALSEAAGEAIRLINDPEIRARAQATAHEAGMSINGCNVLEAVIHINYDAAKADFVDLGKIFASFRVNEEVPFVRFRSERAKNAKYKVYKGLTDPEKEYYMTREEINEWMDIKTSRKAAGVQDIAAQLAQLPGRGLVFKIRNYVVEEERAGKALRFKAGERRRVYRYLTLNIFRDGKLEVKCYWDEKYIKNGEPGAVAADIQEVIRKVISFMQGIQKMQYHLPGVSRSGQRLILPDEDFLRKVQSGEPTNTRIAFFNTISILTLPDELDIERFGKFIGHFNAYASRVIRTNNNGDVDIFNFEMRYKRINNYIQLKGVNKYIQSYRLVNKPEPGDLASYNAALTASIADTFNLPQETASGLLRAYIKQYESEPAAGVVAGAAGARSLIKQPGIDIKISRRGPDSMEYKCMILGVSDALLGAVFNFVKAVFYYYQVSLGEQKVLKRDFSRLASFLRINVQDEVEEDGAMIVQQQAKVVARDVALTEEEEEMAAMMLAALGDEDEGEEGDDLPSDTPEPQSAAAPPQPPAPPPPVKSKKAGKVVTKMIDNLKQMVPELFNNEDVNKRLKTTYTRSCQSTMTRQPLVVSKEMRTAIQKRVMDELRALDESGKTGAEKEVRRRELLIHKKTLEEGAEYQGNFYYCPFTWDFHNTANLADNLPLNIPAFRAGAKNDGSLYYSTKWKSDDQQRFTATGELPDVSKPGVAPPHHYYLSFVDETAKPPGKHCMACCFMNKRDDAIANRKICTGEGVEEPAARRGAPGAANYVLDAQKLHIDAGRYAFIPEPINRIFNKSDDGLQLYNKSIIRGFDYYLRKGVKSGNQFLNAVAEILRTDAGRLIERIIAILDETPELFRRVKQGSLYQLFMPTDLEGDRQSVLQAVEGTLIPLSNFKTYLRQRPLELDEEMLWDLLSMPNSVLREGLNIVICEVSYSRSRKDDMAQGVIKCPIGYDIDAVFNPGRKSLILYKYKNTYEIITRVREEGLGTILFEAHNPLITEIIDNIELRCQTQDNLAARNAAKKSMVVSTLPLDQTYFNDAPTITLSIARHLLQVLRGSNEYLSTDYQEEGQLLDSYNKVAYIMLSNGAWLPIVPSGLVDGLPVAYAGSTDLPDLLTTLKTMLFLTHHGNFIYYRPYAFLLEPGDDIEKADDDRIIGVALFNSLLIFTQPVTVNEVLAHEDGMLLVEHPDPVLKDVERIQFDMRTLLFDERMRKDLWMDDYLAAERSFATDMQRDVVDVRKVYSVRANFELVTYQKLRYEISKYLQTQEGERARARIIDIINSPQSDERTESIMVVLQGIAGQLVRTRPGDKESDIVAAIGPLERGIDGLDDISGFAFNYMRPMVLYECHNRELDELRGSEVHCVNGRLFVSDINLVTGKAGNLNYYLQRVASELLELPLKRLEIMDDQIDNYVSDIVIRNSDEYYLDEDDMRDAVRMMYDRGVDYRSRMGRQYDIVQPGGIEGKPMVALECVGTFENLPSFWINRLRDTRYRIYNLRGSNKCIYTELNSAIQLGRTEAVDIKNEISELITDERIFPGDGVRQGWQVARAYYAQYMPELYRGVTTSQGLATRIRTSDRHFMTPLDLSIISRLYNIRFIIIGQATPNNPEGISCLGTTQTTNPAGYIILFNAGYNYNIVKFIGTSPAQSIFNVSELPKSLFDAWQSSCPEDIKESVDIANTMLIPKVGQVRVVNRPPPVKPAGPLKLRLKGVPLKIIAPVLKKPPVPPVARPAIAPPVARPASPVARPASPVARPASPVARPASPVARPASPVARPAIAPPVARPASPVARPAIAPPVPKKSLSTVERPTEVDASDRCECKYKSGIKKDKRCTNKRMVGSRFCGLHKMCDNPITGEVPAPLAPRKLLVIRKFPKPSDMAPASKEQIPAVEIPAVEIPAVEIPAVEIPAAETCECRYKSGNKKGRPCLNKKLKGSRFCGLHQGCDTTISYAEPAPVAGPGKSKRCSCKYTTGLRKGEQCSNNAAPGSDFCKIHATCKSPI
jgi:hypothetical protein